MMHCPVSKQEGCSNKAHSGQGYNAAFKQPEQRRLQEIGVFRRQRRKWRKQKEQTKVNKLTATFMLGFEDFPFSVR